jgi:carbonic anhydrase
MARTAPIRPFGLTLLAAATLLAGSSLAQKTPDEALAALRDGNRRFAAGKSVPQPLGEGVRRTLARGQSPFAIVLTCADSDVPPEHLFNAGLGELFVIRVAGNACDPEVLASVEYAVEHLQAPLCVVLGHEGCSAVAAANEQIRTLDLGHPTTAPSAAMQNLLERIEPAVRRAMSREYGGTELAATCEVENIHLTVHESLRKSALLRRYVEAGKLRVVPARYRPGSGEVDWLSPRPMPRDRQVEALTPVQTTPTNVPPHVALRLLQAGHRRFLGDGLPTGDLSPARRDTVTRGQRPLAIVLTCSDSRVPPEHVFDAGLGELVVVRVAGHALNDDALASIEHAAQQSGASLLLVMGHTRCGAVGAATEVLAAASTDGHANHGTAAPGDGHGQLSPSMRALLDRIAPAVERARRLGAHGGELVDRAVEEHVLRTVADARERSPLLRQLEQDGKFAMLPTVYDLGSGDLRWLKESEPGPHPGNQPASQPQAAPLGETAAPAHGTAHAGKHGAPGAAPHGHATQPTGAGPTTHKVIDLSHDATATHRDPQGPATAHGEVAHGATTHGATTNHDQPHGAAAHTGNDAHAGDHSTGGHHAPAHGEAAAPTAAKGGLGIDPTLLAGIVGVASLLLAAILVLTRRK